jgi:hypothetical protein
MWVSERLQDEELEVALLLHFRYYRCQTGANWKKSYCAPPAADFHPRQFELEQVAANEK